MHEVNYLPDPRGDCLIPAGEDFAVCAVSPGQTDTMTSLGLTTGLTAFWKMDEASGERADSSGNGYNLTEAAEGVGGVAGKLNNAASLIGSVDSFLYSDNSVFSTSGGTITVSCWVKFNAVDADMSIIGKHTGGGLPDGYKLFFSSLDNAFVFTQGDSGSAAADQLVHSGAVVDGVWYHITCGFDGSNHFMSINGGVRELDGGLEASNAVGDFMVGLDNEGLAALDGLIDEVGIWMGTVLTDEQITALYNGGTPLPFN